MLEPSNPEGIFSLKESSPLKPQVYNQEFLTSLGFSVSQKDNTALLGEFQDFFGRTVEAKRIQDESRLALGLPVTRVLEKNGESFFEFSFGRNLKIIVRSKTETTLVGLSKRLEVYSIEHLLIKGKDKNYLDLMSLKEKGVHAVFYLMDAIAGFAPRKTIRTRGGPISYPPTLRLGVPVKERQGRKMWKPQSFSGDYLHELGHAILEGTEGEKPQDERSANAVGLQIARQINRLYPQDEFFDLRELARDNEIALRPYDPWLIIPQTPIEQVASNQGRKAVRADKILEKS